MPPVATCILSSTQAPQVSHGHDLDRFVQIGSLTKPLTGTLLAQLVEADVLQLDDPLDQFLRIPAGTGITLRHPGDHPLTHGNRPETAVSDLIPQSAEKHLDSLPGFDGAGGLPVHSGRAGTLVSPDTIPRHQQEGGIGQHR
ncbi:serine hydrolase [Streptomyces sp. NPDC102437]|uniref:serine hydrolase n=1 Tax=Streptomyces sp. NPDC102437 TaxID=3366175 RepID=UPI00382AD96E